MILSVQSLPRRQPAPLRCGLQIQCDVNFFIQFETWFGPSTQNPSTLGAGAKTHLKSGFCATLKTRRAMSEFEIDWPDWPVCSSCCHRWSRSICRRAVPRRRHAIRQTHTWCQSLCRGPSEDMTQLLHVPGGRQHPGCCCVPAP